MGNYKSVLPSTPLKVHSLLQGLNPPGPQELTVPLEWYLSGDGVFALKPNKDGGYSQENIANAPVIITGRLKDLAMEDEWLRLAWYKGGEWWETETQRKILANRSDMSNLANKGFPVTGSNAIPLMDYLDDFETANFDILPTELGSSHLGWLDSGKRGFLLGNEHLKGTSDSSVSFLPPDDGDKQTCAGFTTAGSLEGWLKSIEPIRKYPNVLAAFYAALAAPLLEILGAHNFTIDLSSATSQGKTIALRVAASIWGNPDEEDKDSVLHSWDITSNWVERTSGVLHSLPIFLDDTKRCQDEKLIPYVIYLVASGRGKGRATPKGTQNTGYWRTVLISTGEAPLTSYAERHGGAHARVLTLWGPPWEKQDAETGAMVNKIETGVKENYGWAGRYFIDYLAAMQPFYWDDWAAEYKQVRTQYEGRAGNNSVAFRMAGYFAALQIAAKLAHDVLKLPWHYNEALDGLNQVWNQVSREATRADRPMAALEYIRSWAYSNESQFVGRQSDNRHYQGSAGHWNQGENWKSIAFYPYKLKEILEKAEFDWDAVKRSFRDRGWLDVAESEKDERYEKKVRTTGGKVERLIVIRRSAFDYLEESSSESEPSVSPAGFQRKAADLNPAAFIDDEPQRELGGG